MSPKFYLSDNVDWIDPQGKLTNDQWLTVHLVLLHALEANKEFMSSITSRMDVITYMDKAKELMKNIVRKAPSTLISKNLTSATESLRKLYDNVSDSDTEPSSLLKSLYFRCIGDVAKNVKGRFLGKKTFKEYFKDINIYDDGNIFSLKALDILDYYWKRLTDIDGRELRDVISSESQTFGNHSVPYYYDDDDDDDDDWDDDDDDWDEDDEDELDAEEELLAYYEKVCEKDKEVLPGLSLELALAFHAVCLNLCGICLNSKTYSKYQKAVVKAISSYKDGQNQKQQEFNLRNANDAYLKLKDKLPEWIRAEYDDDTDESINKDKFLLASNFELLRVSEDMKPEGAVKILNDLSLNSEGIYSSEVVKVMANSLYERGEGIYETLVDALHQKHSNEDDQDYDSEDDQDYDSEDDQDDEWDEEDDEAAREALYNKFKEVMSENYRSLEIDKSLVVHIVNNNILLRLLPKRVSTKYRNEVNELVSVFNAGEDKAVIEYMRRKADETLQALRHSVRDIGAREMAEKTIKSFDDFSDYSFSLMAMDFCLMSIKNLPKVKIDKALTNLTYNEKTKEYHNEEIDQLTDKFVNKIP